MAGIKTTRHCNRYDISTTRHCTKRYEAHWTQLVTATYTIQTQLATAARDTTHIKHNSSLHQEIRRTLNLTRHRSKRYDAHYNTTRHCTNATHIKHNSSLHQGIRRTLNTTHLIGTPTNAHTQIVYTKTFKNAPTCFDHSIIIRELSVPC